MHAHHDAVLSWHSVSTVAMRGLPLHHGPAEERWRVRQIAVPEAVADEAAAQFLINPTTGAQAPLKPASQLPSTSLSSWTLR